MNSLLANEMFKIIINKMEKSKVAFLLFVGAACAALSSLSCFSDIRRKIVTISVLSVGGLFFTMHFIPKVARYFITAGLSGKDINKLSDKPIPESLGVVVGICYFVIVIMFQPILGEMISEYYAALVSVMFMFILGFLDDVFDLRWRHKILLSFLGTLPLLVTYSGSTDVLVPAPFNTIFGNAIHLGYFYLIFLLLVVVFCTNSINIYAGVNGLEVGQSVIIGIAIIVYNAVEICTRAEFPAHNLLSLVFIIPFVTTSLGLFYYNFYPSKVFVGDTYTYFAGITIAMSAIVGHFTRTVLLFFIPELINFALSIPQLIGIFPCPRHRLPRYNKVTKKLEGKKENLNLLNYVLLLLGPKTEKQTVIILLIFQSVCCACAFLVRYVFLISWFTEV